MAGKKSSPERKGSRKRSMSATKKVAKSGSGSARRGSSVSSATSRRGSSKVDTKDVKNLKALLKEAQNQVLELQCRLEESEPREELEQKMREVEALAQALEDEELNKHAELMNLKEQHRGMLDKLGNAIKAQKDGFEAERHGYHNAISVLTKTCTTERLTREEERIKFVEKVAALQSEDEWLETAMTAVQDKKWLQLDSESSRQEFKRLHSLYGQYLDGKEDGLLNLWQALGKTVAWKKNTRPSQLQLLLSFQSFPTLTFRVGNNHHLELGGAFIPKEEVTEFFSSLLSRIANLEHVALLDCPEVDPLDWNQLSTPNMTPFPQLKSMALWHTKLGANDVIEIVRRLPCLRPCGFNTIVNGLSLHEECLDLQDYTMKQLTEICQRKLWVWGAMISDVSKITAALQADGSLPV